MHSSLIHLDHMAHDESCNTISQKDNFNSPCRSQVGEETGNCTIENQLDFSISQETLAQVVDEGKCLQQYGGINGIAAALESNLQTGISGDGEDLHRRHKAFGSNLNLEEKSIATKGLYRRLVLDAFKDTNLILLLCCAALSLVIGIKRNGPQEGFLDGAIIFVAILLVVNFGVICRFCKAIRINKLSIRGQNVVGVMRCGKMQHVPVSEVVVGDIVCLKTGDRVPADGLFVHAGDVSLFKLDDDEAAAHKYPSMFTGAKVVGGECRMLVTSIGKSTERGKLMIRSISCQESKFQTAIDKTYSRLEKIWLSLSLLALAVQVLRCYVWKSECSDPKGVKNTVEEIMNEATKLVKKQGGTRQLNGLVAMLCILVSALRDGLPLGTFISFAIASKKMMSSHAMVQKLPACATIGLVTTICTGKTCDLALQHVKMADLWIGFHNFKESSDIVAADHVLYTLREGLVCMNTSGPAEEALLCWAQNVLGMDMEMEEFKRSCTVLNRNPNGILLLRRNGDVHVHWRGTPEFVLSMCSHYYDIDGTIQTLDEEKRQVFNKIIEGIESDHNCLQCFAFAYKKVVIQEEDEEKPPLIKPIDQCGLTLLGLVGLKNPYEHEVRQAVQACRQSGVNIKLVVSDDIDTARFMATNSRILSPEEDVNGAVIEASEFRNVSEEDRSRMIDNIRVMANTSPSDKLLMVQCLRRKGEVVAVTGESSRDSSALQEADVGLCLGDNGAEAARESSDIVILDMKFVTVYAILELGRCVCNNLNKFVQLQLTLNIAAFYINFIVGLSTSEVVVAPFELLWANLIMDVLGAWALAAAAAAASVSDPPTSQIPAGPLVTKTMWRNIVVQSLYQVTVLLILDLKGKAILDVDDTVLKATIFNCYVLCQVFVLINAREIKKMNVFEGLLVDNNYWFLVVVGSIVILQVAAIEIPAAVTHAAGRLDLKQWCICIGIASLSMPIGWAAKWSSFSTQAI